MMREVLSIVESKFGNIRGLWRPKPIIEDTTLTTEHLDKVKIWGRGGRVGIQVQIGM